MRNSHTCFAPFPFCVSVYKNKNLLWLDSPSRFFYRLQLPLKGKLFGQPTLDLNWYVYGILCPGPLYLRTNHVMCPWAWRNWLSVGTTSSRVAAPPILPPRLWYNDGREKCVSMSRERCRRTIGGEQRWAAFMVYCARNHYAMEQTVRGSRPFGTVVIE